MKKYINTYVKLKNKLSEDIEPKNIYTQKVEMWINEDLLPYVDIGHSYFVFLNSLQARIRQLLSNDSTLHIDDIEIALHSNNLNKRMIEDYEKILVNSKRFFNKLNFD